MKNASELLDPLLSSDRPHHSNSGISTLRRLAPKLLAALNQMEHGAYRHGIDHMTKASGIKTLPFEIEATATSRTADMASLHFPHIRSIARGELEVFSSYQAMGQREFPALAHINPLLKNSSQLHISYPHLAVVATAIAKLSTELHNYLSQLTDPDAPRAHILPYISKLILLIIRELDGLLPTHEAERTAENMRMTYVEAERANTNLQIGYVLQNTIEQDDNSSSLLRDTDTQHFTTISSLLTELVIRARNGKLNHLPELAAEQPANLQPLV